MNTTKELRLRQLPLWKGGVSIAPLRGGLSNTSYVVTDGAGKHVARFGEEYPFHEVSRSRELMAARAAHEAGFAPAVEYAEAGLMVMSYVDGKPMRPEDVRKNPARVADLLQQFHTVMPKKVSGTAYLFWVFHIIREYARTLQKAGSRMVMELPYYVALADELEQVQVPLPIVYAHNDLLPSNLIDDTRRLWLIDYEYSGFSTPMFDLAGVAANAGMNDEQSHALLETYFGRPPGEELLRSHAAMQCAALLREAMWSMVSELYLNAPGADYVAYTSDNLGRLQEALEAYRSQFPR